MASRSGENPSGRYVCVSNSCAEECKANAQVHAPSRVINVSRCLSSQSNNTIYSDIIFPPRDQVCATQSYMCFRGELFGQPTRFAFHFSMIEQIVDVDQGRRAYVGAVCLHICTECLWEVVSETGTHTSTRSTMHRNSLWIYIVWRSP